MRTALALLAFSLASTLSAANMWFDPPNPTSNTSVVAHVAISGTYCTPTNVDVQRHGRIISITMNFPTCARPPLPGFYDVPVNLGVVPAGVYDVVAGPDVILLGLAEGTLVVRDANPPFLVTPDAGREGDTVTISGVSECSPPAQCSVLFGTTAATVVSNAPNVITVKVPATAGGPTDIMVGTKTAVAAFDVITGGALDPAFFAPVLIPVFFSGNGALGSQWRTEVTVANENAFSAINDSTLFSGPCILTDCPAGIAAGLTGIAFGQNETDGKLIYVDRAALPKLFFDARVRDLSREAQDLGAELPVVREKSLYGGPFDLLNVPSDARFRSTLRVYRTDGGSSVHLTIRPMLESNPKTLVDTTVTLHAAGKLQSATITDLVGTYPQLASHPSLLITVDSGATQPSTWAFVSVTNNDTQRVTVISPQ